MKNVILVTLLASTLGLGAAAVHANDTTDTREGQRYSKQEGGKHAGKKGHRRGGDMMKRMAEKLNLTEAQQAQIKTFRSAQKEQGKSLKEQSKALRTERKALDKNSADYQSQLAALKTKKDNLMSTKRTQREAAQKQFESVLTPEQLATLEEMKSQRKERGGKRGGKHHS